MTPVPEDTDLPEIPDQLFFRIGEVSELLGVEPHVLRYWEQEFRIRPQRSPSGQRMYKRRDLARFLRIKDLLHRQGFTIPGARRVLDEGVSGAPASGTATPDVERLDVARRRIEEVRDRLARLRRRLETDWSMYLDRVPAPRGAR